MIADLWGFLELLKLIESPYPFALVGGLGFFATFFAIYALYDVAFGSLWSLLYPTTGKQPEVLILRLCWAMAIATITIFSVPVGAIVYYIWKLKQLRTVRQDREREFENALRRREG